MGDEQKVKLERILEIAEGVSIVGDNDYLDGTTSYKIGRLGDHCKSPSRQFNKGREKKRKEIAEKQRELQAKNVAPGISEEDKRKNQVEMTKLNEEFNEFCETLADTEELIKIPKFKLSEFLAKEERKVIQKVRDNPNAEPRSQEVTIKAGQALVPVRFFTMMGDIIEDDKAS